DPQAGLLAPASRIERRLNAVLDPAPVPEGLPTDRVNVLLVIARPKEDDVKYRSIARPLVELIETKNLPAYVHVLRPPTFDHLREHLRERPGYYHLVHFDGHGGYGVAAAPAGPHTFGAPDGGHCEALEMYVKLACRPTADRRRFGWLDEFNVQSGGNKQARRMGRIAV